MTTSTTDVMTECEPGEIDETRPLRSRDQRREVRYEYSSDLADVLTHVGCTLLISTYQAGKLAVIGSHQGNVAMSFHNFDRPMGLAVSPAGDRLAVAARDRVWLLRNAPDVARRLDTSRPPGSPGPYGACYLTRSAQVTGEIQAHEMGWCGDELWVVNTLFSCLCTLDAHYSFVPRWTPPFISGLAAEDRCHLNGLALADGHPKYATAMGETDSPGGWRQNKTSGGCVIEIESGQTIARGLAMPHSPRVHDDQLWLLDSGRGSLMRIDPRTGNAEVVARFPGYTRGLTIHGGLAFVGLSRIRETSTFGGVPIAERREELKCGVGIVHLGRGELVGQFEFKTGVEEIFEVTVLPNVPMAAMRGPFALDDGNPTIWVVPDSPPSLSRTEWNR